MAKHSFELKKEVESAYRAGKVVEYVTFIIMRSALRSKRRGVVIY